MTILKEIAKGYCKYNSKIPTLGLKTWISGDDNLNFQS